MRCLYCYKELKEGQVDYHPACSKKLFGTKIPPQLPFVRDEIGELAKQVVRSQTTLTGVQAKLSLDISRGDAAGPPRFTGTTVRDSVLNPACIRSNFAVKIGLWTKWNFTGRFFNPSRPYALEANNHVRFLPTVGITELSKIKCVRY